MVDFSILFFAFGCRLVRHAQDYRQFLWLWGLYLTGLPPRFRPVAGLQLPLILYSLVPYYLRFVLPDHNPRIPRLGFVVVLHCLGG